MKGCAGPRSEERRVGNECRSRWSAYNQKIQSGSASVRRPVTRNGDRLFKHVLACVDRSPEAAHVLEQAVSLANLSGADLTAMRVMPGSASSVPHADPVDWELTRREEVADLMRMASAAGAATDMHAMVVCGSLRADALGIVPDRCFEAYNVELE